MSVFGYTMLMEKKDVRLQLVISPSELEALDAWRAERRIFSRSEAIRRLVAQGIQASPFKGNADKA